MLKHFRMMADYNQWANNLLYDAVATIDQDAYFENQKGFFNSIHGTLNHILVGDRIWLKRFTGDGEAPDQLNAILYNDFDSLRTARASEDQRIISTISGFDADSLASSLHYSNTAGKAFVTPMAPRRDHFFNHQTHHRGQVHDMLSQTGMIPPQLDLLGLIREKDL